MVSDRWIRPKFSDAISPNYTVLLIDQKRMSIKDQPPPIPNESRAIADLVILDMQERKQIGIERYGTPLQAFNGRDPLIDAYQEALDLCVYLRQAIEERKRFGFPTHQDL